MASSKCLGKRDLTDREIQTIASFFNECFVPVLLRTGFLPRGETWFRTCNDFCLQLIRLCYGSSDQDDIQICADIKPLCERDVHWYIQEAALLPLQQELCDIVYDTCDQYQIKRSVVCSSDNCNGILRPTKHRIYRSAYYAREYDNELEACIQKEFELLRTITLPLMEQLTTPREYIAHCYQCANKHIARTYSCEAFRHSALWAHDWGAAEYATNLLALENSLLYKDEEIDVLCATHLKNIRASDDRWVSALIDPIVKNNLHSINRVAQLIRR